MSLYVLKQASKQRYEKFSEGLLVKGYSHSQNDYSPFYKNNGSNAVLLAVYVDDILMTG